MTRSELGIRNGKESKDKEESEEKLKHPELISDCSKNRSGSIIEEN